MGTKLLGFSIGRGSGALKGLSSPNRPENHFRRKATTSIIARVCSTPRPSIEFEEACRGRGKPAIVFSEDHNRFKTRATINAPHFVFFSLFVVFLKFWEPKTSRKDCFGEKNKASDRG